MHKLQDWCAKICPALHPVYKNNERPSAYAVWADDGLRKASSSGGVFLCLQIMYLEKAGMFAGQHTMKLKS